MARSKVVYNSKGMPGNMGRGATTVSLVEAGTGSEQEDG